MWQLFRWIILLVFSADGSAHFWNMVSRLNSSAATQLINHTVLQQHQHRYQHRDQHQRTPTTTITTSTTTTTPTTTTTILTTILTTTILTPPTTTTTTTTTTTMTTTTTVWSVNCLYSAQVNCMTSPSARLTLLTTVVSRSIGNGFTWWLTVALLLCEGLS